MYVVGIVLKPQGLHGELKVLPTSERPERFRLLKRVYLQKKNVQTYSIETIRIADRFVFLKFNEINTRDDAEKLRDCELLIDQSELLQLAEDEYYVHDLIDCRVYTENGSLIGKIDDVIQAGSNDLYVVVDEAGKEVLIPAVKHVIKEVDIIAKQVIIRPIEGLTD